MLDKDKVWYLAGPMSGIPQFNFPLFMRVAAELRESGCTIINPAEQDSDAVREAALASQDGRLHNGRIAGETWGDILARDVKLVADVADGVVCLPDWYKSRGACLEVFVALLCKKPMFEILPGSKDPVPLSAYDAADEIVLFTDWLNRE